MCPRCVRAFRNAARIEVVSPRPANIAAHIEVLSLRPASKAARIEVVSPRPASIAAQIEELSLRPARNVGRLTLFALIFLLLDMVLNSSSISSILCTPSFRDLRTRGARSADQVDQMSPESNEDYRAGRVTNGVMRN
ncbi:hypothetical protein ACE6H2_021057 [Prunus campanulata]